MTKKKNTYEYFKEGFWGGLIIRPNFDLIHDYYDALEDKKFARKAEDVLEDLIEYKRSFDAFINVLTGKRSDNMTESVCEHSKAEHVCEHSKKRKLLLLTIKL